MHGSGLPDPSPNTRQPPHLSNPPLRPPTLATRQAFNILCEHPETVAAYLVPRARSAVARGGSGAAIRYLTPLRVLAKLLAAPAHAGRYFDRHGEHGGPCWRSSWRRHAGVQLR